MKKIVAIVLALCMCLSMSISASAITTGNWDFGAISGSVDDAVENYLSQQEHEVTYDLNGGFIWNFYSSPAFMTSLSYTDTGSHTVTSTIPTRALYTFVGWEYDGEIYTAGDEITLASDITLTAVWKSKI